MTGMKERGGSKEGRENYKNITTNRWAGEIIRNACRKAAAGEQGERKEVIIILGKKSHLLYGTPQLQLGLLFLLCSCIV